VAAELGLAASVGLALGSGAVDGLAGAAEGDAVGAAEGDAVGGGAAVAADVGGTSAPCDGVALPLHPAATSAAKTAARTPNRRPRIIVAQPSPSSRAEAAFDR
jgi:hypothetical protein